MTSKSTTSTAAGLLILPLLLAGAVVLWLMTGAAGHAATATQTQALQATVTGKTIAWGSGTGCTQDMGTADFGSVIPGATAQSSTFTGCVTSNASGWSVTAAGTNAMTNPTAPSGTAGSFIPNSAVVLNVTSAAGMASPCGPGVPPPCSLDVSGGRTLLGGATSTSTTGFSYRYDLNVPANQPAGTYTGGQVTFTASN
jgi:hypothetical protein